MTQKRPRKSRLRVFLLHNMIAPYRLPLFQTMAGQYDLRVYFCLRKSRDRLWQTSLLGDYTFFSQVLPHVKMGPFVLNPTLPFKLLCTHYDVYIVGGDIDNAFTQFIVVLSAKISRKPLLVWSEAFETEFSRSERNRLARLTYRCYRMFLYREADAIIALSNMANAFAVEHGVPQESIVRGVQVMPQELIDRTPILTTDNGFRGRKVVLYLGYLRRGKGIDLLINAFKQLQRKDAVLLIVGSGDEEDRLKALSKGDSNIYFAGYAEEKDKSRYYSLADIFVLPTLHDPWGLTINEAMSFGLPIITTSAAGASEIIQGSGLVIPPKSQEALLEALQTLLDNDSMREEMRRTSKARAKEYDISLGVSPFIEAIERVRPTAVA